jgi:hypothetical protein
LNQESASLPQSDNALVNHRHRGGGFKFHS